MTNSIRIDDVRIPAPGEYPLGACAQLLLGEGRLLPDFPQLTAAYGAALWTEQLPVDRVLVLMPTLHPLMGALNFVWSSSDNSVREIARGWSATATEEFKRAPIASLLAGSHGVIRRKLCDPSTPHDFEIVDDLIAQGFTDYLIASIAPAAGRLVSAVSWATRTPGGFTEIQLQRLLATLVYFAPLLDTHAAQRIGGGLLKVYLGGDAGARVMEGAVRRGDGGEIRAAICFTDLRGFTALSDRLPRAELLELLNAYFDCVVAAVHAHGGEVLKFIGDAVLAIFRIADDTEAAAEAACLAALHAAQDAFARGAAANSARPGCQPIEFGTAIHIGDVEYGNIGAADRLDFTVIGPAVNLASRLQGLCGNLGQPLLVSEAFATTCAASFDALGDHQLKGVAATVKVLIPAAAR